MIQASYKVCGSFQTDEFACSLHATLNTSFSKKSEGVYRVCGSVESDDFTYDSCGT